ncbi:hypothetical protein [Nonlabens antarcticus]|uniref:hypothetical protein n=1 Tax=Nonlabens antarcticus TaxID=392714 RepID=UPI001E48DF5B|nr:hypothetical protein [Nonlabens antarcticus]
MKNLNEMNSAKNEKIASSSSRSQKNTALNLNRSVLLAIFMIIGGVGISNAQLQEGTYMLGTDLGSGITSTASNGLFGFNFGLNDGAGYNVGLAPKVGYFVADNVMLGAVVNLGFTKSPEINGEAAKATTYGIQALSRYYLAPGEAGVDNLLNKGRFFLEANAGIAGVNIKDGETTNGFAFGFGPGYSYFVTDNVALETSVKYNGLTGFGNAGYQNSLGLNLGIQIFLPSSKVDSTF